MSETAKKITQELEVGDRPAISKWKKWAPLKWLPIFDQMIICSVAGESNNAIAAKFKYTPQHVSTILNLPEAKVKRRMMYESLQKGIASKTEERLAHIHDRALTRMTQVMDNEELVTKAPLAILDRSVTILKGMGTLKGDSQASINAKNAVFITPELSAILGQGLKMADEAKKLNSVETTAKDVTAQD